MFLSKHSTRLLQAVLLCALILLLDAFYIQSKALLAQWLIAAAWRADPGQLQPWPWADTGPIAKLSIPSQKTELFVMAGAHGQALAFGPGHSSPSAMPGASGISIIGGHRDTHFARLGELEKHQDLIVEKPTGQQARYKVVRSVIVDSRYQSIEGLVGDSVDSYLMLITCYPITGELIGGPLRYVVIAQLQESSPQLATIDLPSTSFRPVTVIARPFNARRVTDVAAMIET